MPWHNWNDILSCSSDIIITCVILRPNHRKEDLATMPGSPRFLTIFFPVLLANASFTWSSYFISSDPNDLFKPVSFLQVYYYWANRSRSDRKHTEC